MELDVMNALNPTNSSEKDEKSGLLDFYDPIYKAKYFEGMSPYILFKPIQKSSVNCQPIAKLTW